MQTLTKNNKDLQSLYDRNISRRNRYVEEKVKRIIEDIRNNGDKAVIQYTHRFDKANLLAKDQRVSAKELNEASRKVPASFIKDLKIITCNVKEYYRKQLPKSIVKKAKGVFLKENVIPLDTVGIYVPAGTAPLVSTVYMTVIPDFLFRKSITENRTLNSKNSND